MKTMVIAEAGSCHLGDYRHAVLMVEAAVKAGADVVKFQWTSDPAALAYRRNLWREFAPSTYSGLAFPSAWHGWLADRCASAGVGYACTVYLAKDIEVVAPYVALFKVASFEALDRAFRDAHEPYLKGRPLIVSTGMMGAAEVRALSLRAPRPRLLHCVSSYPSPIDEVNLSVLRSEVYDGFSDHTADRLTGALAVVLGAAIVEVHFRLDSTPRSAPDYPHSHSPSSLTEYIANIRTAERMRGDGAKRPQPSEEPNLRYRVSA